MKLGQRAITRELTLALHAATCTSEFCDGGDHLKRFRPIAREALRAADPIRVIHDRHCPLATRQSWRLPAGCLGPVGPSCGDNAGHMARYREIFAPIIDGSMAARCVAEAWAERIATEEQA